MPNDVARLINSPLAAFALFSASNSRLAPVLTVERGAFLFKDCRRPSLRGVRVGNGSAGRVLGINLSAPGQGLNLRKASALSHRLHPRLNARPLQAAEVLGRDGAGVHCNTVISAGGR